MEKTDFPVQMAYEEAVRLMEQGKCVKPEKNSGFTFRINKGKLEEHYYMESEWCEIEAMYSYLTNVLTWSETDSPL